MEPTDIDGENIPIPKTPVVTQNCWEVPSAAERKSGSVAKQSEVKRGMDDHPVGRMTHPTVMRGENITENLIGMEMIGLVGMDGKEMMSILFLSRTRGNLWMKTTNPRRNEGRGETMTVEPRSRKTLTEGPSSSAEAVTLDADDVDTYLWSRQAWWV